MPKSQIAIGFVPLLDSAVLVSAVAGGFTADEGLDVRLVRESAWSSIRDRLAGGHLHAAHMLAPMPIAANLGLFPLSPSLVAPFALGLGGNAVTVSNALAEQMRAEGDRGDLDPVTAGAALREGVRARRGARSAPLRFGVVYHFSGHNYELRYWLAAGGIDPDHDVEFVILPPPYMPDALAAGRIDGYCVGEPWNSSAVMRGVGRIATVKARIWRSSPEKVLGVARDFAETRPEALDALLRALYRAAQWCGAPENREALASILAAPAHLGLPRELLLPALSGEILAAPGRVVPVEDFFVTAAKAATFPWQSHALWFYSQMVRWGDCSHSAHNAAIARDSYRPDLYRRALRSLGAPLPGANLKVEGALIRATAVGASAAGLVLGPDGFFDGHAFDPDRLDAYLATQRRAREVAI